MNSCRYCRHNDCGLQNKNLNPRLIALSLSQNLTSKLLHSLIILIFAAKLQKKELLPNINTKKCKFFLKKAK